MSSTDDSPGPAVEPDPHQRLRELLGVHALGHLAPGEDAAVRAHLDGCAACRTELAEIAPLREALAGVDPERLASPSSPPPWLGEQVRRSVAAERTARDEGATVSPSRVVTLLGRRLSLLAVAAAAVLVVALVGGGAMLGRATAPEPPAGPFEAVSLQVVGDEPVSISRAGLVPHTWGVELRFTGAGFEEGEVYRAVFVDKRGRSTPAGEFLGTGEDEMVCNLQSAILRQRATEVVITDATGDPVVRAEI